MSNEVMSTSTEIKGVTDNNANLRFVDMISESDIIVLLANASIMDTIFIQPNSVLKIISLMASHNDDIENICCSYVTCKINEPSVYSESENPELDPMFASLLGKSKSFTVTPTRTSNNNNTLGSILITDYSLRKISQMLNSDITELSDYISIAILIFANDELHERQRSLNRLSLRANILEKYAHSKPAVPFNGISLFDTHPHSAKKNPYEALEQLDTFLDNVNNFIEGKPQIHLEHKVAQILDLSEIGVNKSGSEINGNINKDNTNNNNSYINHKKLLVPRQRLSHKKEIKSPMFSFSNKKDEAPGDISDDIRDVIQINEMYKNAKTHKVRTKSNVNRKGNQKENNESMSNIYVLKDADGNCVLVPEKTFVMLNQAHDKGRIKSGSLIAIENDDGKIVQVDSDSVIDAINNEDKKLVKIKDLFDKDVIVSKKDFFRELEQTKQEGNNCVEMEDFSGQKVYIKIPSSTLNTKKSKLPKRLYYIRLARIEINEISNYYTNTGEPI